MSPLVDNQDIMKNFIDYLPPKPYCTDALGYLTIRPKVSAVKYAYIQYNPIHRAYWLVYDLDYAPNCYWPDEHHIPTPNMTVMNPRNGHQHLFYQIDPAVYTLRQARQKPLRLAADVDRGLTIMLDADPSYGKLITKNPCHKSWIPYIYHEKKWDLTELIGWIPDKIKKAKVIKKPRGEFGLGRNCTVFDKSRFYAYNAWQRQGFCDYSSLLDDVYEYATGINYDFSPPLQNREINCIVRSICKWTSRYLTPDGFYKWGDMGRKKSIFVRQRKSQARADEAKALYASGKTQRQIATILNISVGAVNKYVNTF